MPRASREQRAANHEAILRQASHLLRERGTSGFSVPDVMAAAGLTHGGFYKHFTSKDDLLAQAEAAAVAERGTTFDELADRASDGATARAAVVGSYLSGAHRDHPSHGCPTAALAADVARPDVAAPVRDAYVAGVRDLLKRLERLDDEQTRDAAADLALMVGAVLLARATAGDELSDRFLDAARAQILPDPTDVHA